MTEAPAKADLLIVSRGPWLTLDSGAPLPRAGAAMNEVGERHDLALAIAGERILEIGPREEMLARYPDAGPLDLGHRLVMPGFVDPHTHPVFNRTRELEFEMRNQGRSYVDIAKAGGGIRNSVRSLREVDQETLEEQLERRVAAFLRLGTTTIEAKSGYGLSLEAELKSLRAIKEVARRTPLDLVPTFLGAHEIPDEYRDDREAYIRLIIEEMIPAVVREDLARFCDVFCEEHVFTVAESRRILEAARRAGLEIRIHADEIESTGGAELAAEVGAWSADHLGAISAAGIRRLGEAGVIPILLPGTTFFLNLDRKAPGRKMIDSGLAVALATDYNPGSCHTRSMPMIMTLACIHYAMTAAEALSAATVNAACSLGLGQDRGLLKAGYRADLIALDLPDLRYLPYHFGGENFVSHVIKNGRLVVTNDAAQPS
ncbi:MAG: imidazolonepropionase [Planctomycetes bacterium]|nr:imidazolonepropionase [Planctomycetota bacterium]